MNATTLCNIKISKSGVKLKTISTGLMAEISVYDVDDKETYVIYCYKDLAEKVSRMKLQPREYIIATGRLEYIPVGENYMKILKATAVEYCKASAKPETMAQEPVPQSPQTESVEQKQVKQSEPEVINLDEVDIFSGMLCSADEL